MKFTAKTDIAMLDPPAGKGDVIFFDDDLPGFGLRLRKNGDKVRRSWIAQYKVHRRTRRFQIGSAATLDLDQARAAAKKILAQVALGGDPQESKAARRALDEHSLRSVIAQYLADKETRVRPRTMEEAQRYLNGSYFRPLHAMPVDKIGRKDVAARLLAITKDNGSVPALRARAILSAMYVWALGHGLAEANPVIGTIRPAIGPSRERVLSDDELIAIWNACRDDEHGRIVKLLLLTTCRRNEVGNMVWSEIDLERGVWTIPAARTKNARAHALPLPRMALDIIESVPCMVGRDQLFGVRGHGFTMWTVCKRELDARAGVAAWHIHDLRRTAATRMNDLGVQPHIVEVVLNHHSGFRSGVAGVYNRASYTAEVRAALALWADHLRALVEGGERRVLAFPQATA
jgi:integrase